VRCSELVRHLARCHVQLRGRRSLRRPSSSGATATRIRLAANTKLLPPFAYTYIPDANGADGGFYPDTSTPIREVETYGATPAVRRRTGNTTMTTTTMTNRKIPALRVQREKGD